MDLPVYYKLSKAIATGLDFEKKRIIIGIESDSTESDKSTQFKTNCSILQDEEPYLR